MESNSQVPGNLTFYTTDSLATESKNTNEPDSITAMPHMDIPDLSCLRNIDFSTLLPSIVNNNNQVTPSLQLDVGIVTVAVSDLEWITVKSEKNNPEGIVLCTKCKKTTLNNPNYIPSGLAKCTRVGCHKLEVVAKEMVEFRRWKFISVDKSDGGKKRVNFICDNGHTHFMNFEPLRRGASCRLCITKGQTKEKTDNKVVKPNCNCEGLGVGFRSGKTWICPHYNHAVLYPDSASEWDYDNPLNKGITPYRISPCTSAKYWFRCKKCKMSYEQQIDSRAIGQRCRYCSGNVVCASNCLATTHPELCLEWDPDNAIKTTEISFGSTIVVGWICNKHEIPFRWEASPNARTGVKSGCPKCNMLGFEQRVGGHGHFVKVCNEIHENKYTYPDQYVDDMTHLTIICPNPLHGEFYKTPHNHKAGQGCPVCTEEQTQSKGIAELKAILTELGIKFLPEQTLPDMKHICPLWLDLPIPFDRPLCDANIEYDGEYHTHIPEGRGGEEALIKSKHRDCIKDLSCIRNKVSLWRIPYTHELTKEYVINILNAFMSGKQIYASYPEYIDIVSKSIDLSSVVVIPIDQPK